MQAIMVRLVILQPGLPAIEAILLGDGSKGVTVRSVCLVLGLSRQGQVQRIKRTPELAGALIEVNLPTINGPRFFDVLPVRDLAIWAIGIDAGRLAPHKQELVALIKEQAVAMIERAFTGDAPEAPTEAPQLSDARRQEQARQAAIAASASQLKEVLTTLDQRLLALERAPQIVETLGIMPERMAYLHTLAYARRTMTSIPIADTLAALAKQFGVGEIADIPAAQWPNVVAALEDTMRQDMKTALESQLVAPSVTPERLAALKAMPYEDYLRTSEWRARRQEALRRALYRCQLCNSPQPSLEAHHRTYDRQGAELPEDLTVLCSRCHLWYHRQPDAPAGRA